MIRKSIALIITVIVVMLLWSISLIPIQLIFGFLIGVIIEMLEYESLSQNTILVWEAIARMVTTILSGYISYKLYKVITREKKQQD